MVNTWIEDKIQIQELAAQYALAMDEHDLNRWLETWTPNGRWEGALGTYQGENLKLLLRDLGERIINRRHVITNYVIDVKGNEASQTCYMQIVAYKDGPKIMATAVYRDDLVKVDGKWKFSVRRMNLDS